MHGSHGADILLTPITLGIFIISSKTDRGIEQVQLGSRGAFCFEDVVQRTSLVLCSNRYRFRATWQFWIILRTQIWTIRRCYLGGQQWNTRAFREVGLHRSHQWFGDTDTAGRPLQHHRPGQWSALTETGTSLSQKVSLWFRSQWRDILPLRLEEPI